MKKLFYTIGEVADILGENTSLVRFWANRFPEYVRPSRNAKGNRLFTENDLKCLKNIHHLVNGSGMTLDGVRKHLSENYAKVSSEVKLLESLKEIRAQLLETRNMI